MNKWIFVVAAVYCIVPQLTQAQVLISEVAWMGTDTNSAHEWIELYNLSLTPTDLTGWTLVSEDGAINIALSGTLSPHGVVLVERATDSAVPGVAALLTYDGEMADAGGALTLKNPNGAVADEAGGGSNWSAIGGNSSSPKKTAQRTRTAAWVTAAPTPGADNAQVNDPISNVEEPVATTSTTTVTTSSGQRSGGSSKAKKSQVITITASTTVQVGNSVSFGIEATGNTKVKKNSLSYAWNFGDGTVGTGASLDHIYAFPGEYIVIVEATSSKKLIQARYEIKVVPQKLALAITETNNVAISNVSDAEVILDGYTIEGSNFTFTFPKNSLLKSMASITLAALKINTSQTLSLIDPTEVVMTSLAFAEDIPFSAAENYGLTSATTVTPPATVKAEASATVAPAQSTAVVVAPIVVADYESAPAKIDLSPELPLDPNYKAAFQQLVARIALMLGI